MSRAENRNNGRRTAFALPQPLLAGLFFAAALTPCPLLAQTNTARAPLPSNRCLLVVETSRSMQRRSDATLQIVQDMLKSGLAGQLRRGDTLGVWTYNESLYAGRFPLQTWSPEVQEDITLRALAFLKDQKYEKQPSFDKVLPALNRLIKDSPLITVILISSADEKMRGTPFDDALNQFYQKWHNEQRKARMPFVTVLRAQDGQLGDFAANTPPFPVEMPHLRQETQVAETIQTKLLEAVRTAPPPTAQPLIISGKKTQPEKAPAPKPAAARVKVDAPAPVPGATSTNKSLTVKPPTPVPPPVQIARTEAAPVVADKPSVDSSAKPSPAPAPVTGPAVVVVTKPETKPVAPAPAVPEAAPAVPVPAPAPKPAAIELPKPAPAPEPKPAPAPRPVAEPKVEVAKVPETKPVVSTPPKVEAALVLPAPAPKSVPAPPAAREASAGTSTDATVTASSSPSSSSLSPRPAPLPVPRIQTATALPAETLARNRNIWIAALVLAGVAIGFAFLLLRRSRAAAGASLITRSLERRNKP